jgi:hypothetical protein
VARDPLDVIRAASISIALLGATLSPLARDPADDGFPLSTYPMFASPREVVQTIDYAIGETATGERRVLSPELVGTREVLQAYAVIAGAVARGEAAALCRAIARRVPAEIAIVRVVRGTHDAVAYLVEHRLGDERELARCAR